MKNNRKKEELYGQWENIPTLMLNELSDIQQGIMFSFFVEEKKKNRMIEKWNALDDQCGRRGIKTPFDA